MKHDPRARPAIFALATALAGCTYAHSSPRYELVAATGRQASGTPPGTTFGMLGPAAMNAAGQVLFNANLNNAAPSNDSGMWLDDTLVARAGDAAPGDVPDLRFRAFSTTATPLINDAGMIAFATRPEAPGVAFASNDFGIWAGQIGNLQLVALAGSPAPGLGHSALFRVGAFGGGIFPFESPGRPSLSESGQLAFWAEVEEDGELHHAMYVGAPSAPKLVARANGQAYGLPPGVNPALFTRFPSVDGAGNVLFNISLDGPGVTTHVDNSATYLGNAGGVRLLHRKNDPVGGVPGGRWGDTSRLTLNEAGQMFFADELRDVPQATRSTLWFAGPDEAPRLVGRAGEAVPGSPGHRFGDSFQNLYLDDSGRVLFTARADPAGSTASGPVALWTGTPDDFDLAVAAGSAAPGTPAGVVFGFFENAAVNANGMIAFDASLAGAGVTIDNNDALYAGMPGDLHLLAREGDYLEVAPGDVRKVLVVRLGTGLSAYNEYLLNDSNEVVAGIRFTDGSDAIFRVTVPEPGAVPAVAAALLLLPRRRRNPSGR